jgi:hypothetical protein
LRFISFITSDGFFTEIELDAKVAYSWKFYCGSHASPWKLQGDFDSLQEAKVLNESFKWFLNSKSVCVSILGDAHGRKT